MGRRGGSGGRNLGGAMSRAAATKKGREAETRDLPEERESLSAGQQALVQPAPALRTGTRSRTPSRTPKPRDRPGRRNQAGYSARSISILESVYENLDQALVDPELQRQIKVECAEWGVWVPQKKAGKSELMELLLLRWLDEVYGRQ